MKIVKLLKKILYCMLIVFVICTSFGCTLTSDERNDDFIRIFGYEESFALKENVSRCEPIAHYGENKQVDDIDTVKFGKYEQDNNFENGKEDIEWIVLEKSNGKALLLSKYILDNVEYNYRKYRNDLSWRTSSLFEWLNNDFICNAFTIDECRRILPVEEGVLNANDVYDKVFLLNDKYCKKYFGSENDKGYNYRLATKNTKYALERKLDNAFEYLIQDSNKRQITYEDIIGFDEQKIRLAINEIYARHGRKFKEELIKQYFNSKKWYKELDDPEQFDESLLSSIEWSNIEFLNKIRNNISEYYNILNPNIDNKEKEIEKKWYSENASFWLMNTGELLLDDESILDDNTKAGFVDNVGKINKLGDDINLKNGIRPLIWIDIKDIKLDQYVLFGKCEQDNNFENGKEDIEWLIIDSKKDISGNEELLLVSKYLLDAKPFNEESKSVSWKECTLRQWLNNDFYNESFDDYEKKHIVYTEHVDVHEELYLPDIVSKTKDNVFLLSFEELEKHFGSQFIMRDKSKSAKYTDYTFNIANKYDYNIISFDESWWGFGYGDYWMRDYCYSAESKKQVAPHKEESFFINSAVAGTGWIFMYNQQNDYVLGVRPAIWVKKKIKR